MWSSVRSQILLQCVNNAGFEEKIRNFPEALEALVNRLHQLFGEIRILFGPNKLFVPLNSPIAVDWTMYDKQLYIAIGNYLNTTGIPLNYVIKPTLTDPQLDTIKCVIETVSYFTASVPACGTASFPENIKREIIQELSLNFDVANDRCISYYENIFIDLNDNLIEENAGSHRKLERMRNKLLGTIPQLDHYLFTKLIIFIRSRMLNGIMPQV